MTCSNLKFQVTATIAKIVMSQSLNNIVSLLVKSHKGFICGNNNGDIVLPFVKTNENWNYEAKILANNLLSKKELSTPIPIKIYKVYCPSQLGLYNVVYEMHLDDAEVKQIEISSTENCLNPKWTTLSEVSDNDRFKVKYWAELVEYEQSKPHSITEITKEDFIITPNNIDVSHFTLIQGSKITETDQTNLQWLFLTICWPETVMSQEQFVVFGQTVFDYLEDDVYLEALFKAADIQKKEYLCFREIMILFAACDMSTPHHDIYSELRCRYIFRLYDSQGKGFWTKDDLKVVIQKVKENKKIFLNDDGLEQETNAALEAFEVKDGKNISLKCFLTAAGDLKFRGTSTLLRFKQNFRNYFIQHGDAKFVPKNLVATAKMRLASHAIKFNSFCHIEVNELWSQKNFVSRCSMRLLKNQWDHADMEQCFKVSPEVQAVLDGLNYFSAELPSKEKFSWGELSLDLFGEALATVCDVLAKKIVKSPRLLEIASPVYVLGDLHGNFESLLQFEKILWRFNPTLNPCKILFLGDYVDRGLCSVEVVAYLFAYKCMCYDKIQLIRGNHEIRDTQYNFTFHSECIMKFGNGVGNRVFTAVNNVFDSMPLASVIDGSIFCSHGGIPPPWIGNTLDSLASIPCPLPLPIEQSQLAWNLMWNDPVSDATKIDSGTRQELANNNGFAFNSRRGTGNLFDEKALNTFLQTNRLTHLIRAHEAQTHGVSVQFAGKLVTVFSSSNYCGTKNDASCLLIESNKIRILRMDVESCTKVKQ